MKRRKEREKRAKEERRAIQVVMVDEERGFPFDEEEDEDALFDPEARPFAPLGTRRVSVEIAKGTGEFPDDAEEGSLCMDTSAGLLYIFAKGKWTKVGEQGLEESHIPAPKTSLPNFETSSALRASAGRGGHFGGGTTGAVTIKSGTSDPSRPPDFSLGSPGVGVGMSGRIKKSTEMTKYEVFCVTEQRFFEVIGETADGPPQHCPRDDSHEINPEFTSVLEDFTRIDDAEFDSASLVSGGIPGFHDGPLAVDGMTLSEEEQEREEKRRKLKESMRRREEKTEW